MPKRLRHLPGLVDRAAVHLAMLVCLLALVRRSILARLSVAGVGAIVACFSYEHAW